jgi:SAM-dependent methyltransferase
MYMDKDKLIAAMRGNGALSWADHHPCLFSGTERFFRPGYRANLVSSWLPALEGVVPRLEQGAKVADIGCGHGASTIVLAQAFPNSTFHGFDFHGPSIEEARRRAADAGVEKRATFSQASAKEFPGRDFDLVCFFDCLHDMGDPVGAARHAHAALKPGGTVLLVEPYANDSLEENLNPVGRLFYAASTCVCTPNSLSQEVGLGLGAQAGEKRLRHVFMEAGFSHFRRATETPFNLVLEARK